jgi:2-hydroxy-3-keto-5-methylthiopentenyl-1-phosphate phosphatase
MNTIGTAGRILVSDFDGTMTRHDFYKLAIASLISADTPDYWAQYRSGSITHFEALRLYFSAIRSSEDAVLAVVRQMELDPMLPAAVDSLRRAGWRIVVTSAGCAWYIQWLLKSVDLELEVYANPGRFEPDRGLLMQMPTDSPFLSPKLGVDKTGVVRSFMQDGLTVAFAGDGYPDVEPARLVAPDLRFARADLADVLRSEDAGFHSFNSWSDIAACLLQRKS